MFLCQFFHKSVELLFYSCPAVSSDENAVLTNVNPHGPFYHFNRLNIFLRYYYICYFFYNHWFFTKWLVYFDCGNGFYTIIKIQTSCLPWTLITRVTLERKDILIFFIHLCSNLIKIIEIWDQKLMNNQTFWTLYMSRSITCYDDTWNASIDMVTLQTITCFSTS